MKVIRKSARHLGYKQKVDAVGGMLPPSFCPHYLSTWHATGTQGLGSFVGGIGGAKNSPVRACLLSDGIICEELLSWLVPRSHGMRDIFSERNNTPPPDVPTEPQDLASALFQRSLGASGRRKHENASCKRLCLVITCLESVLVPGKESTMYRHLQLAPNYITGHRVPRHQ